VTDGPNLILLSRYLQSRDALTLEFEKLRGEFPNLRVHGLDPASLVTEFNISAEGVVVDLGQWSKNDESIVDKLRAANYAGGIIIISHRDAKALPAPTHFEKIVFLDKPYKDDELLGLVSRMLLAPVIAARKFPRHPTDEAADLQIDGRLGAVFKCRVRNMSKGGAYLEPERPLHVRIGDSVTLKISLGEVKRVYAMRARVAWINTEKPGFGVEFVITLGTAPS
jgi:hypothetical protein